MSRLAERVNADMTVKDYARAFACEHGLALVESADVCGGVMVVDATALTVTIGREAATRTLRANATTLLPPNR